MLDGFQPKRNTLKWKFKKLDKYFVRILYPKVLIFACILADVNKPTLF